jgi:hypothetical protein
MDTGVNSEHLLTVSFITEDRVLDEIHAVKMSTYGW